MSLMKLSVVFPVKNQTEKLLKNIREIGLPFFDKLGETYEFLIVYDGSDLPNKKAMEEARSSFPLQIKTLPYEDKSGKGHNVKKGIMAASGDFVLFMDADFATSLDTLKAMLAEKEEYDAFIASRHLKGSEIRCQQSLSRRLIGSLSRKIIKWKFHFPFSDTQCGFKMFRTSVAKMMAERQIIDGFAFDVEYLYFLSLNGFKTKEFPCVWVDDANSSIKRPLKTSLAFMSDMRKIKRNRDNYRLKSTIERDEHAD